MFRNLQFSGLIVYCTTKLCHSLDSVIFGKYKISTYFYCSFIHIKGKSEKTVVKLHPIIFAWRCSVYCTKVSMSSSLFQIFDVDFVLFSHIENLKE